MVFLLSSSAFGQTVRNAHMSLRTVQPNIVEFSRNLIIFVAGTGSGASSGPPRLLPAKGNSWRKRLYQQKLMQIRGYRAMACRATLCEDWVD